MRPVPLIRPGEPAGNRSPEGDTTCETPGKALELFPVRAPHLAVEAEFKVGFTKATIAAGVASKNYVSTRLCYFPLCNFDNRTKPHRTTALHLVRSTKQLLEHHNMYLLAAASSL